MRIDDPLRIKAAISLGGLPDLEAANTPPGDKCGPGIVPKLVGPPSAERPDVYADTSPAVLPQPLIPVTLVNGDADPIVPPVVTTAYIARTGSKARVVTLPEQGHVELITPGTRAWNAIVPLIESALR